MNNTIYPDYFNALLENSERKPFLVIPPKPQTPGDCPNCGGIGFLFIRENKSGPYPNPSGKKLYYREGEGWYSGDLIPDPCPVCSGEKKAEFLATVSGLEGADLEIRLDDFMPLKGKEEAKETAGYILGMTPAPIGLYTFYGDFGVGKTTLLKALTNGFRLANLTTVYRRMSDILNEVKETYGDDSKKAAQQVLEDYRAYKVVLIDEVDRVYKTDWALDIIFTLLDDRYNRMSSVLTVLATNAAPEDLDQDFPYLSSRMKEGIVMKVGGADVRPAKGLQKQREYKDYTV